MGAGQDRWIVVSQMIVAFLLIVFGACLSAFGGLKGNTADTAIPIAVIGAGAALLPSGAAGAASARILQMLPSSATPDLADLQVTPATAPANTPVSAAVMLTAPAPPGGFAVTLAADPAGNATLPSSVTVPAGSSVTAFQITPIISGATVTITATAGSTSQSAPISVT